eukprot:tig00000158_g10172.t1
MQREKHRHPRLSQVTDASSEGQLPAGGSGLYRSSSLTAPKPEAKEGASTAPAAPQEPVHEPFARAPSRQNLVELAKKALAESATRNTASPAVSTPPGTPQAVQIARSPAAPAAAAVAAPHPEENASFVRKVADFFTRKHSASEETSPSTSAAASPKIVNQPPAAPPPMQLPAKQDAKGEAKQDTKAEAKPDAKTGAGPAGPTPSAGPPALNAGPPNASPAAKTPSAPSLAPPPASSAAPAAPVAAAAPAAAAPALAAPAASVPAAQLASASSTPSSGPGAGGLAGLPPDSGLVRSLQAQLAELRSAVRDIQGELQDLRSHVDDRVAGPAGDAAAARSAADRALQETVSNRLEVDALRDRLKDVARALAGRVERGEAAGRAALDDAGARWARDLERLEGLVDEGARAGALLEERMAAEAREAQERFQRLLEDCKRHADAGDARLKAWNEEGRKALLSSLEHTWNKCQDGIKAVSEEAKARNEKVTKSVQEGLRRFEEQATRMRASADEIGRGLSERIAGTARDTRAANESLRALVESQIRAARAAVGDEVAAARDECARLGHHVESQLELSARGFPISSCPPRLATPPTPPPPHSSRGRGLQAWAGGEVAAVRSAVDSGLQAVREEDQRLRTSLQSAGDGMLERVQSAIRGQQEEAARAAKWLQERTEWLQKRSEEEWTTVAAQLNKHEKADAKLRERIEQEQAELRAQYKKLRAQVDRRKKELEAEEEALRGWAEGQRAWIGAQCDALRAVDKEIREWLGDRLTAQQQRCARPAPSVRSRPASPSSRTFWQSDAFEAACARAIRDELLDLADTDIVEADRKPLTASFCGRPLGPRGAAMVADAINASALQLARPTPTGRSERNGLSSQTINQTNKLDAPPRVQTKVGGRSSSQVCVLDVRDARLGDRGAEILASQLAPASGSRIAAHLAELRMAGNGLGPRGVEALAEPLATNTVLKALDLSRNDCSHVGARALAAALQGNRTLTSLTLDDCKLVSTDVAALAAALDGNATLLHLR